MFAATKTNVTDKFERTVNELKQERRLEIAELQNTCTKLDRKINAHNEQVMKLIRKEHMDWRQKSLQQLQSMQLQIAKCRMEAMEFRQKCLSENNANQQTSERTSRLRMLLIDSEYILRKLESLRIVSAQKKLSLDCVTLTLILYLDPKFQTVFFELGEMKKVENNAKLGEIEELVMNVHDKVTSLKLESEIGIVPRFDGSMKIEMEKAISIVKTLLS